MMPTRRRISRRSLSPGAAALTLSLAVAAVAGAEVFALRAKERAENPPRRIDASYCTNCHKDAAGLKKLRLKEGGSGFLFNADGTLRDPAFAARHATRYREPAPSRSAAPATAP
jgi:hypothetical protein